MTSLDCFRGDIKLNSNDYVYQPRSASPSFKRPPASNPNSFTKKDILPRSPPEMRFNRTTNDCNTDNNNEILNDFIFGNRTKKNQHNCFNAKFMTC